MPHYVYILCSKSGHTYYIGETEDLNRRLDEHNNHFFRGAQTTRARDWEIYLTIPCFDRIQARNIEKHIKKMKSRVYMENLKKFPEMIDKLKNNYR